MKGRASAQELGRCGRLASVDHAQLRALLRLVRSLTGFEAWPYRESTLRRRLELRLQATACESIREYIRFMQRNPAEAFNFKENLLIHVTRFFRDRSVFTFLERRLLPLWLDKLVAQQRRTLRVWSVGCASGQEPFSLAMVLHRPASEKGLHPIILATDVSARILARSREAVYRREDLRPIPLRLREIFFTEEKSGLFRVSPFLRRMLVFRQHDLVQDEPPGTFDLIMCRNLLIFFRPEFQDQLLQKISTALTEGGLLILGRSERISSGNGLQLLSARFQVYQKRPKEEKIERIKNKNALIAQVGG